MHSIAASAVTRDALAGEIFSIGSARVLLGANTPLAFCHFSKKRVRSAARSLMIGRLASGPISSLPSSITFDVCVRQVQRGRPLTVIAHDPHMPTRQAKR
jgi:hypothetical protein